MDRILDMLARFCIKEFDEKQSHKYRELSEQSDKILSGLGDKLNNEEETILIALLDNLADEKIQYAQELFVRGYKLGVQMTMEVLMDQDIFFTSGGGY